MTRMMQSAIAVQRVTVRREGNTMLDDVTFGAGVGSVVALVGPNGAGKTSLLRVIAGDLAPDQGRVSLAGHDIARLSIRDLSMLRAVLPQQTFLQFGFIAREIVSLGRNPLPPVARRDDDAVIDASLERTDTGHLAHRRYPTLSGGEQNRVSLARILAQETPIVLLDEPTAALDIRHQHLVMGTARELAAAGGTVVAILHDLNLAMTYADRIAVLDAGRLLACDEPWVIAESGMLSGVFRCRLAVTRHPHLASPLILSSVE